MRELKRVVISGATSFTGSAVVRELLKIDCQIYGIVRPASQSRAWLPDDPRFHEVSCDISETGKWLAAVGEADTFFHYSWGGPGISGRADAAVQEQSAEAAFQCIRAAAELGVSRFILSGSQAEYGQVDGVITEETPCHPIVEYGKNKLKVCREAPELTEKLGMEYVHARIFSLYGPHDHPYALVPACIRTFLNGETMILSECRNRWNFLHVSDAASAAVLLAECELPRRAVTVNLAGNDTRILREFVEEIHTLAGGRGSCAFGARKVSERSVDNWPDNTRLRSMISWEPRISFSEGIRELIEAERLEMGLGQK